MLVGNLRSIFTGRISQTLPRPQGLVNPALFHSRQPRPNLPGSGGNGTGALEDAPGLDLIFVPEQNVAMATQQGWVIRRRFCPRAVEFDSFECPFMSLGAFAKTRTQLRQAKTDFRIARIPRQGPPQFLNGCTDLLDVLVVKIPPVVV